MEEGLQAMRKMPPSFGVMLAKLNPLVLPKVIYIRSGINCLLDGAYRLSKATTTYYHPDHSGNGLHYPVYSKVCGEGMFESLLMLPEGEMDDIALSHSSNAH